MTIWLAYEDYERLRDRERQVHLTSGLPPDLADAVLTDLDNLRAPYGAMDDGDTTLAEAPPP